MNAVANTESVSAGDGTPEPIGSTNQPTELSKDELFHLLQNQRRRRVLLYLQETDSEVSMRDIAEQVAAWENDTTVEALSSDERQRVYIALYQSHLPKLDDAGVLSYNQQRGIVARTPLADQLDSYLNVDPTLATEENKIRDKDSDENREATTGTNRNASTGLNIIPNSPIIRYYGAATLASAFLTGVSWTGLVAMPGLVLATFITGLFVTVTIGIVIQQQSRKD